MPLFQIKTACYVNYEWYGKISLEFFQIQGQYLFMSMLKFILQTFFCCYCLDFKLNTVIPWFPFKYINETSSNFYKIDVFNKKHTKIKFNFYQSYFSK